LHIHLKGTWNSQNLLLIENKIRKYYSKCQDKMDFNVEPYQKSDGVMVKYVALPSDGGLGQPLHNNGPS
jgi:hypothetical protein